MVFSKPTSVELHKCLLGSGSIANRAAGYGPVDKSVRRALPSPFSHRLNLHHHRDHEWATSRLFAKESRYRFTELRLE